MPVDTQFTPLPPEQLAPIRVEIADWLDLNANTAVPILEVNQFAGQAIDVRALGGRPETDVFIEAEGTFTDSRGVQEETTRADTDALGDFNFPITSGPIATDRLVWRADNQSGTAFTDAGNDPYQAFLNYEIRNLTIVEKLRRNLPLTNAEEALANRVMGGEVMSLVERDRLNVPPETDPAFQPNLEGKNVIETDAVATTFDIDTAGTVGAEAILDVRVDRDPVTQLPSDVLYLTSFGGNWAEFSETENIALRVLRGGTDEILRVNTFGLPGMGDGTGVSSGVAAGTSDPPYLSEVFIPATDRLTVQVFSDTTGQTPNGLEVRAEFARVERTLVEKALYGLEDEVQSSDAFAQDRNELFERIRDKLRAGLPITLRERRQAEQLSR